MRIGRCCVALLLSLGLPGHAFAARYAILVGVSQYAADSHMNLDGPAQDIPALKKALLANQGFQEQDITVLLDRDATRKAILDRLAERVQAMKAGDYLLFYFGGHGTSAFDTNNQPLAAFIGPNSGALVPHDFSTKSIDTIVASLIIGQRDLRPILDKIPAQSEALVILDACYSENSVKSTVRLRGKNRGIVLGTMLAAATASTNKPGTSNGGRSSAMQVEPDRLYPYANVIALTASSKDEPAVDIGADSMVNGRLPTVDGKPHGAFTNSLLQALAGPGDLNHDGKISFQELHDYTRRTVQSQYSQTPQLLMPAKGILSSASAFAWEPGAGTPRPAPPPVTPPAPLPCEPSPQAPAGKVRVRLENVPGDVRARLERSGDVELTSQDADIFVRFVSAGYDLYDRSGTLIRSYRASEDGQMVARILAQPRVGRFIDFGYACQTFNASLRLRPEGQSRFSPRDVIQVDGIIDRAAYLLLFDIDKSGAISLVYPAKAEETNRANPGTPIFLGPMRAAAPFGSEYLKLFAFPVEPPLELLGCRKDSRGVLDCPDIEPGTPRFDALVEFLERQQGAESRLRLTTYE
jgi:hypothetical protein